MKTLRTITGHKRTGLFSVVNVLLELLLNQEIDADYQMRLGPEYLYFDPNIGLNVWEYYFNQPKQIYGPKYEVFENGFEFQRSGVLDISNRSQSYEKAILEANLLFTSRIGFSPAMISTITDTARQLELPEKYFSVHKRETDSQLHASEIITCDHFFKEIETRLDNEIIYLATDSEKALREFKFRYGSRLIHLETFRSKDNTGLHFLEKAGASKAKVGSDAVLDAVFLSRGVSMFRTRSNLTTFSRVLNPNLECFELDVNVPFK